MPDRVHAEFPQNKRMLAREILQSQQVTFEVTLIVKVNVETAKIGILRQQIFRRRVRGIGKKGIRIDCTADPNQFLYKFNHPTRAEPAGHCAGDFVADQITENCWMSGVFAYCVPDCFGNLLANRSFAQELDMFFPGKRHQYAHPCASASVEKPGRRCVINSHNIQADLAHEGKIDIHLLRPSEIVPLGVRLEGTVCDTFDEKLFVTFQKEFRRRANSLVCRRCHVERSRDIPQYRMRFNQEIPRLRSE